MRRGAVQQRHLRSCPRDAQGKLLPHRCKGNWAYVLEAGRHADGTRRQISKGGFANKRDAENALDDVIARERSGLADAHKLTVEEFLRNWLRGKRKLRDTTRRNYETHLRRYLIPTLGPIRLSELRPQHIDNLYDDILAGRVEGATKVTVHHVHRTLRSALNTAVKQRLIPWNPAAFVELPERSRTETHVWTPGDVARFLHTCQNHRLGLVFHVIAFTGMRRGEALGLHWTDVDFDGPQLTVRWQVVDAGRGPQLGLPKTRAGIRTVPIDGTTRDLLKRHRRAQAEARVAAGPGWVDTGLVFTRENGSMLRPDGVTHLFKQLVHRAGVPEIRLHDLRHTHASLALAAGVDMKVVSDRLGHSTTAITADLYTHVIPSVAREAADAIAALIPVVPMQVPSAFLAQKGPERTGTDPPSDKTAGQRGAGTGTRTPNRPITSRVRYQLRHAGGTWGR